ncbi:DNA recombination protein RmuC [Paracidovorax valerianellae]|uniref:DNA recombination protein RmuC n=1 Tax=Paracidovorax valerianellae TaxID=187868 RepID=A0A1G6J6V7_9BURK|nr:DNA recombination protein RmuC [Paracidovorax valerianellae]
MLVVLVVLGLLVIVVLMLGALLLRSPRAELPPEWLMRLQRLEATAQATQLAVAKNDGALDGMAQQLRGFTQTMQGTLENVRQAVDERLAQAVHESRSGRAELLAAFAAFEGKLEQRLALGQTDAATARQELVQALGAFRAELTQTGEALRGVLNERLSAIQADNAAKLEEMRRTVDEKLHATLEQRLGESFKLVSDRLEQVHKGLGEMQTLAGSVGDLKRVMTNVKTRGTWGEMQLGAIIDNVLTVDQFARNVKVVPGSDALVEFAIRLPGRGDEQPVWLPIDSKYPVEQYQRLLDAHDAADKVAVLSAGNAFEASIKLEARKIFAKYVSPPHTTDFAVMYLPTEGLFAEVIRRPGLVEALQNDCRVMITGPANLAAMLSSLQMGFKTLAIEKRSSEVWGLLGAVKTEFGKFGEVVEATRKSIDAAAKRFDEVGVRTRAIQRRLSDVQALPAPVATPLKVAGGTEADRTPDEDEAA